MHHSAIAEFASLKERECLGLLSGTLHLTDEQRESRFDVPGTSIGAEFGEELIKWKQTFAGKHERCFLHTSVIIAIRRGIDLQENLAVFYKLWDDHRESLATALDLKWLTSACDTFLDYPRSESEQVSALCAVLLVKTVKLYETEHRLYVGPESQAAPFRKELLFDGLLNYSVGAGDLVDNLEQRMKSLAKFNDRSPTLRIVQEVFERVLRYDTAFKRIR